MSMRLSGDPHVTSTVLTYFDVASHCRRVLIFAVVRGVSAARLPAGITCSPLEGRERRTSRMSGLLGSKAPSPSRWWTSRTHITWPSTTNCAHVAVRNLNALRDALPCRVPTPTFHDHEEQTAPTGPDPPHDHRARCSPSCVSDEGAGIAQMRARIGQPVYGLSAEETFTTPAPYRLSN
jgi:hypothetical protein